MAMQLQVNNKEEFELMSDKPTKRPQSGLNLGLRFPHLSPIIFIIFTILLHGELWFVQILVSRSIIQLQQLCSGKKLTFVTNVPTDVVVMNILRFFFVYLPFPVTGWLADAKFGRLKVINMSIWLMWWGLLIMVLSLLLIVPSSISPLIQQQYQCHEYTTTHVVFPLCGIFLSISLILISVGAGAFLPNILPFIIDQLTEASSSLVSSYVRWYTWAMFVGHFIALVPQVLYVSSKSPPSLAVIAVCLFCVHSIVVIVNIFCQKLLANQSQSFDDPYRTVFGVVKYARKHKFPVKRSAMTYCERGLPSRLDLAKEKYGGPYTHEKVENVKTFFSILMVFFSLAGYCFTFSGPYNQLPAFLLGYDNRKSDKFTSWQMVIIFTNPIVGILLLPICDFIVRFVRPKFEYYVHKPFLWIGIGYLFLLLCNGSLAIISGINIMQQNATNNCFLYNFEDDINAVSYIIPLTEIPSLFFSLGHVLVFTFALHFICCQAPSSMRGMLLGLFLLGRGCFIALGSVFSLIFIQIPECSVWFWLSLTVIGSASIPVYIVVAKKYRRRERQEIVNYRAMIESVIEREICYDENIQKMFASISDKCIQQR